jgi:hypothetical protein
MLGKKLTEGDKRTLEHVRRARSEGILLSEYGKGHGLSAAALYMAKSRLKREGKLTSGLPVAARPTLGEFIGVQLAPSPRSIDGAGRCRLRHPSGWMSARICLMCPGCGLFWQEAIMLLSNEGELKVYLHRAPIDIRRQRNGLAALVREVVQLALWNSIYMLFS